MENESVLVIDDELGPRESLRFVFKGTYEVRCADSVDRGIEMLRDKRPDVVIMDIKMPEKDGIQGLREIRRIDKDLSVIMLTGFGSLETAQEAIRLGASDYVKKPFDAKEMMTVVERHIEKTSLARMRAQTEEQLRQLNASLRDELRDKDRLASLGEASSAFVHDIRGPLTVISGYAQMLSENLKNSQNGPAGRSEETLAYLTHIEKSVHRCQEMASFWRARGCDDAEQLHSVRMSELIGEVADAETIVARDAGVAIEIVAGPPDCEVMGNNGQLFRALQNLVSNSIQALSETHGLVSLSWAVEDEWVVIRVRDNGHGIKQHDLGHLFRECYSTRRGSGGTGLGLLITRKVIETLGGTVTLANREDCQGAEATVRLPLHRG